MATAARILSGQSVNFRAYGPRDAIQAPANGDTSTPTQIADDTTNFRDAWMDNIGPNDVHINCGDSNVDASLLSKRIPFGATYILDIGASTHVATICAPGESATLHIHLGVGQ